ncbi:MAG: dTDP-4-dehydrorhamnose 3,5-epimerase [Sphingopyxis sp.]|jgi:dTDP-4-dehydrorhamnose 3,5-epimerase|uniref:dTDP-4-dehydrorhamnose 3,5-epimerase n=1 Tax=Sphingopyxis sp. TaxID=1908224 RepID=UPI001A59B87A|nr:dTDP-4-dehydrorhamnose 3,5-epimerase [Sphingopyxis sp.]MBL9071704.1 dTDP-4-dehydrorhamnose 3,5-epimerase [Sphingopyxis sp.]
MSVRLIATKRFQDERGWFAETWSQRQFHSLGIEAGFVQDNHSYSQHAGTLRGLHFQSAPFAQAKLVRCLKGRIFDVAVDIRRDSPTFAQWVGAELSAESGDQLFVPQGFAHAFLTLEPHTEVAYKVDAFYDPASDGGVRWDDPLIGIEWPLAGLSPILSAKDLQLPMLADAGFEFPYDGRPLLPLGQDEK